MLWRCGRCGIEYRTGTPHSPCGNCSKAGCFFVKCTKEEIVEFIKDLARGLNLDVELTPTKFVDETREGEYCGNCSEQDFITNPVSQWICKKFRSSLVTVKTPYGVDKKRCAQCLDAEVKE